ncbi:MAG: glutamate--cysteine ligase [Acidimicrobiaceae bacterium]|nr:glutamate--cysteine ligase [Acidimicrobiaceae bacterium]
MPAPTRQLELDHACALIAACGFGPPGSPRSPAGNRSHRTIGVELESFVVPSVAPERLPEVDLPARSRLTFEPGGQVELSSPPERSVASACDSLSEDLAALEQAFSSQGVGLLQKGVRADPPPRLVDAPRYRAMETYFAPSWPEAGKAMMCATASVQVNLGLGAGARARRRWLAANVLGPVLAAAFSSSPGPSGGGCRRMAVWLELDPSRTAPVADPGRPSEDPGAAWARYALAANVMLIRTPDEHHALVGAPLTAGQWIEHGHELGWPTADDIAYHLTTLFPPVRPRGWLELRMIDALPDPWWRVPVAAAAVLLDDDEAVAACEPVADRWWEAATDGLADPALAAAAAVCARRTLAGLGRVGADVGTAVMTEQWAATVRKGCEPPWQ